MKKINNFEPVNKLRKRYILALGIIAAILIISQGIIQFAIYTQSGDSRVINIAGRQRMLSQKITKYALEIQYNSNKINRVELANKLQETIDLWEKSHTGLQFGASELALPVNKSEVARYMFAEIEGNFEIILDSGKQLVRLVKNGESDRNSYGVFLNRILENEPTFLAGMDKIVFQFDLEASQRVAFVRIVEIVLFLFAILVLTLEALFIFLPAEKQIRKTVDLLVGNEDNIRKLFDIAPTPMFLVDTVDYSIVRLNQMASDTIQLNFDEAYNRKLYDFVSSEYLMALGIIEQEKYGGQIKKTEVVLRDIYGTSYFMLMSATRITFYDKGVFLVGFSDYTDIKKKEERLEKLATIDEMTGLTNRRTGLAILQKEIERNKRDYKVLFTLCFIDLDQLKKVNDIHGHIEGDWFIRTSAAIILKNARSEDTVFRYGGDEIIILFNDCDEENSENIMKRIMKDISEVNENSGKPFRIDLSYGLAKYSGINGKPMDALINMADERMYMQKTSKRLNKNT